MSKTINQLDLGTEVMIKEYGSWVKYIVVLKDQYSTVVLRDNLVEAKRMNATNVAVYEDSEMDVHLEDAHDGFLARFDADTQSCIVNRSISTYSTGDAACHYIARRCFLLPYGQLFLENPTDTEPEPNIVTALMTNKHTLNQTTARIAKDANGNAHDYWTRSPYSGTAFWFVNSGGVSNNINASNASYWYRPALSVANATLVSDEVADTIYLNPSGSEYREVEFITYMDSSQERPSKADVRYTAFNLQNVSVMVSNNAKDANPVWVDATSQQEVVFENRSKTTEQWELAVKCYGRCYNGEGYFEEPDLVYLTD